jgi:hypothetical protein
LWARGDISSVEAAHPPRSYQRNVVDLHRLQTRPWNDSSFP